jgi:hypothetical protein
MASATELNLAPNNIAAYFEASIENDQSELTGQELDKEGGTIHLNVVRVNSRSEKKLTVETLLSTQLDLPKGRVYNISTQFANFFSDADVRLMEELQRAGLQVEQTGVNNGDYRLHIARLRSGNFVRLQKTAFVLPFELYIPTLRRFHGYRDLPISPFQLPGLA